MAAHPYLILAVISLGLGLAAGGVMHRADYCLAGMFRDLFLFRQSFMLRTLLLLVTATMACLAIARLAGLPLPSPSLFGPPGLANLIGGFCFGAGMVLAGGCVVGTLYKMGSGSLLSAVAFLGLLAGSAFYAEIAPGWSVFSRMTTFGPRLTLPEWLGLPPALVSFALVVVFSAGLVRWRRDGGLVRSARAEGYLQPWLAALLLALVVVVSDLTVGMPLGVTTAYAKLGGYLESLVAPRHFATLAFYHRQGLSYV
ncbi:MAG TPA: YeeE/YedE thiosulfate transporter family protein, partial [Desulfuromonadales bacterium]|nr:YeeE/YedE thiosulfate transporter family protein [Desulfuromonadales bacterium]